MAKTSAPLLGFTASGQIGKTQVYAKWKGRGYARRYTVPANPQTAEQTITRNAFSFLQSVYKVMPALAQAPWAAYANGKVLTDRNAFTKFNLPVIRDQADLTDFIGSPGALGGLPPASIEATAGNDQISVAVTAPSSVPSGWTIDGAVAMCIRDQDPDTGILYDVTAGEDLTSAYAIVLTGLTANLYQVRAWLRWLRPDGKFAYSPSLADTATPT